jgi:5-methyltetrahydrofolate--homocysteine methyltransferase
MNTDEPLRAREVRERPVRRDGRDFDGLRQRYEAWWRGEARGPLLYMIHPRPGHDYPGDTARPWMAPAKVRGWTAWEHEFVFGQAVELAAKDGDLRYVDEAVALLARYADATETSGDGYRFLFVNLGASMLSAFLTGVTRFDGATIWLELDEELSLDRIAAMDETTAAPYAETAMEAVRRLAERLEGRFVFGMPDFGSPLDILAAMRKTMNLLVDTSDEPEKVDACVERLRRLYWHWHGRIAGVLDPRNGGGWTSAMRLLSGRPSDLGTCDFSAMISPAAFERWEMPHLAAQAGRFPGRVLFHLDGPGEIPHLDRILSLPGVGAVQWVPGAGKPGGLDPCWDGLYRRILDAGKNVQVSGAPRDPERLKAFFAKFPAGRFFVQPPVSKRAEAEAFRRAVG